MVNKPDFIVNLERTQDVFSIMKFHKFENGIIKYLDDKNYARVFEEGQVKTSGKAKWVEVIFKTAQPFYLHFINDTEDDEQYWLNIYYKAENRKELIFFISQILKPFKDGTTNNTTAQGEN